MKKHVMIAKIKDVIDDEKLSKLDMIFRIYNIINEAN